jgi:hypothetical protein
VPSLRVLYDRYKGDGLVVIGQHIGDDAQTRSLENLKNEIVKLEINYVIIQDLSQDNWYAQDSQYIPTYYLIDRMGNLRYKQVGGGNPALEKAILKLLKETVSKSQP